jgi:anaphase-promoting complex subunit 5
MLTGTLYSHLADAYMGLANPNPTPAPTAHPIVTSPSTPRPSSSSNRTRNAKFAKAELYVDRARDYFKRAAYLDGECEQIMKKAIIAKLRGDEKVAEEWAMRHNAIWEESVRAREG